MLGDIKSSSKWHSGALFALHISSYSINNIGVETRILRSYGDSENTVDILLENTDINKFRILFESGGGYYSPYISKSYVAIPKTQLAYWN